MADDTRLLYLEDEAHLCFEARVLAVQETAHGYAIILDRTGFFPEGGGQPSDTGTIGDVPIERVTLVDGVALHHCKRIPNLRAEDRVLGRVDTDRRHDLAQQHTAQHLISAVFYDRDDIATIGFHLGNEESTVDLDINPAHADAAYLDAMEFMVNARVWADKPVRIRTVDPRDTAALRGMPPEQLRGDIRIVVIDDDLDQTPCCGTHVRSTGQIGPILFTGTSTMRGNLRLAFLAGGRALKRMQTMRRRIERTSKVLGCSPEDLQNRVENLLRRADSAERHLRSATESLAECEARAVAESIRHRGFLQRRWEAEEVPDDSFAQMVGNRLPDKGRWIFLGGIREGDRYKITVLRSPDLAVDLGTRAKALLEPLGGRGGGPPDMLRGMIPASAWDELAQVLRGLGETHREG